MYSANFLVMSSFVVGYGNSERPSVVCGGIIVSFYCPDAFSLLPYLQITFLRASVASMKTLSYQHRRFEKTWPLFEREYND